MTVWYAGWDEILSQSPYPLHHKSNSPVSELCFESIVYMSKFVLSILSAVPTTTEDTQVVPNFTDVSNFLMQHGLIFSNDCFWITFLIKIPQQFNISDKILCFVDRAFLYNLVNKANVVHNFSLYALFLFSTCFGR
jgi:hypothetical protein